MQTVVHMTLVETESISKVYKMGKVEVHALRGIDLRIDQGKFVVILGPSGSGKTTLLNIIGGMDTPTEGKVLFGGEEVPIEIKELAEHRRENVGFVFQFLNLLPTLTAVENVELALELVGAPTSDGKRDFSKTAIRARAIELLTRVGLGDRLHHFPAELSGGEQQRVSIARALAKDPPLVVGDEPTGSLDVKTGSDVLEELLRLKEEEGKTVLLVTHNREISKIADIIVEIRDGRIGTILENPEKKKPQELRW
ncbi:MAG: ABC transporter ATP-binding protein [Candidatus Hermodarchaeota archaeon]